MRAAAVEARAGQAAERPAGRWWRRLVPPTGPSPVLLTALAALALGVGLGAALEGSPGDGDRQLRTLPARVDSSELRGASGELILEADGGAAALLRVRDMRQLPAGRVYQVWVERRNQFIPAGLLAVRADGTGLTALTGEVRGARAVHLTRERRGGAPAPTEPPVLSVKVA